MNRVQKSCSTLNTSLKIPLIVLQYIVSGIAEILKNKYEQIGQKYGCKRFKAVMH